MKKIILAALLVFSYSSHAQLGDLLNKNKSGASGKLNLFKEEKFEYPQYKNHIGEVCFSNEDFERTLPESKYIKSFKLGEKLAVRSWFANSPANSILLQLEENGVSVKEINQAKKDIGDNTNVYIELSMDGKFITSSWSPENAKVEDLTKLASYRFELNDGSGERYSGEELFVDLMKRTDLLTGGTHRLKLEVFPRKGGSGTGTNVKYKAIAVGEIDMIVPETKPTAENCFPYKALSDTTLEAEVLKLMKGRNPNAFKVILNSQVKIIRNDYDVIINKTFNATIVSKTADKVWYDVYRFDKFFNGTGYDSVVISKDMENALLPKDWKVNKDCLKFLK